MSFVISITLPVLSETPPPASLVSVLWIKLLRDGLFHQP